MKIQSFPSFVDADCGRVRVAEGEVAAVDRCRCGTFQVHLAALTLRLAPEALASLRETLSEAIAASSGSALGRVRNAGASDFAGDRWSKS
jgi:hypothetical protein